MWLFNSLHGHDMETHFLWTNTDVLKNFKSLFLLVFWLVLWSLESLFSAGIWSIFVKFGDNVRNILNPQMVFQIFYFFHNSWDIASIFKTVLESATLKLKNEALNPNSRHHFFWFNICRSQCISLCFNDCLALSGWKSVQSLWWTIFYIFLFWFRKVKKGERAVVCTVPVH